jgi:hypothetical protein
VAKVVIGGVDYEVRPFKFRELKKAAPAIDRIGARAKAAGSGGLVGMSDGVADILEVIAIGINGKTADDLGVDLAMSEVAGLQSAFAAVLTESGLKPAGEAKPAEAPADPSPSDLTTSSPNSSAPDAETGTA